MVEHGLARPLQHRSPVGHVVVEQPVQHQRCAGRIGVGVGDAHHVVVGSGVDLEVGPHGVGRLLAHLHLLGRVRGRIGLGLGGHHLGHAQLVDHPPAQLLALQDLDLGLHQLVVGGDGAAGGVADVGLIDVFGPQPHQKARVRRIAGLHGQGDAEPDGHDHREDGEHQEAVAP